VVKVKFSTIRNIWAIFGVIWFVIFFLLTFVKEVMEPAAILAAISLYAGIILAAFTVIYLAYNGLRKTLGIGKKARLPQQPQEIETPFRHLGQWKVCSKIRPQ
jgi:hypothetical protein